MWHVLHRGICFLFIAATILSNGDNFIPIVLMCFRWWASTRSYEPQFAQACSSRFLVLTFHFIRVPGSSVWAEVRNLFGVYLSGGQRKSIVADFFDELFLESPSAVPSRFFPLVVSEYLVSLPNLFRQFLMLMSSFLHRVFLRLSLRIQCIFLSTLFLLSANE